jgi:hypothetical protein
MKKQVEIAPIGGGYEVRLVEKTLFSWRVKHKTICPGPALAQSVAKSIAAQNGQCAVKDATRCRPT